MTIEIPELAMVVLVGPSGAGKSTFARAHFAPTEILNADVFRGMVSDDENDQTISKEAFEALHAVAGLRLKLGKLVVVDATNVWPEDRRKYVELARQYHCLPVAIVLDMPTELCVERNQGRPDRTFGSHVVFSHATALRNSLKHLEREGFRHVFVLKSPEEVEAVTVERKPLWNDLRHLEGPFDIIGDVHGCCDELEQLLDVLGYVRIRQVMDGAERLVYAHPEGRTAVFLGDLVDRGPRVVDTLFLVRDMVEAGTALCVPGNHDVKLLKKLRGKDVRLTHGLAASVEQIEALEGPARVRFLLEIPAFLDRLIGHYVLDHGELVVAHAGMKEELQGRGSGKVREFALYGETTGETDEFGLPIRLDWAADYRGRALVVYGHTPTRTPAWANNTVCIDTGCVFGGSLTALRYPEKETVSVPAARVYCEAGKPFLAEAAAEREPGLLDLTDVLGKRVVHTRLLAGVTIREDHALAALEVMSRFAVDPRWLIHLPPTMSPAEASGQPGFLEHPHEAFAYYRGQGVSVVMAEEKHMGSRAVLVVCRDEAAAERRFGIAGQGRGTCYTRTGRPCFDDERLTRALVDRVAAAFEAGGAWDALESDWVCLDAELLPGDAEARARRLAEVGSAARGALPMALQALERAAERGVDVASLLAHTRMRDEATRRYVEAYRALATFDGMEPSPFQPLATLEGVEPLPFRPLAALEGVRLAPFHLLASEGHVHVGQDHAWHMAFAAGLHEADPALFVPTRHMLVDVTDPASVAAGVAWWLTLGEGMVVKPLGFLERGAGGLVQPALKCRGQGYLRLVYGPEYDTPAHLEKLRARRLGHKRALAQRELALGVEALERFVRHEPLHRVHECVFGVLALESEPVDQRL